LVGLVGGVVGGGVGGGLMVCVAYRDAAGLALLPLD
jgi:hypothetical protein